MFLSGSSRITQPVKWWSQGASVKYCRLCAHVKAVRNLSFIVLRKSTLHKIIK